MTGVVLLEFFMLLILTIFLDDCSLRTNPKPLTSKTGFGQVKIMKEFV